MDPDGRCISFIMTLFAQNMGSKDTSDYRATQDTIIGPSLECRRKDGCPFISQPGDLATKSLREDRTKKYWDEKWNYGERPERCVLNGSDGEEEFDRELDQRIVGKKVLDAGCGPGDFTLTIAKNTSHVTGVDNSTVALEQARRRLATSKVTNAEFLVADVSRLPFRNSFFDIVYSRRGPGSDSSRSLTEIYRVLRKRGMFMEITIGERDKQNIARIFGRGQMLHVKGQVSDIKERMLEEAGFRDIVARDYLGTEVFMGMRDLLVRFQSAPIIPGFNTRKDWKFLQRVRKECATDRGIETPVHRVVLIGRKI